MTKEIIDHNIDDMQTLDDVCLDCTAHIKSGVNCVGCGVAELKRILQKKIKVLGS